LDNTLEKISKMTLDQGDKNMYGSIEKAGGNMEAAYDGDDEGDGKKNLLQQQQYQDLDPLLASPARRHRHDSYDETKTRRILSVQVLAVVAGLVLAVWGVSAFPPSRQQNSSTEHSTTTVTASLTRTEEYTSASTKKPPHLHDPRKELFFTQIVDHNHPKSSGTYQQRYYENLNSWKGPGHPIFVIFGGEGPLEKILYPFISEILASKFGAVTLNPEHR